MEYFIWRNLDFSSFDKITNITNQVIDTMTESEVTQLLEQYQVTPNEENEVDCKFNMLYKNLLLNLNGFVLIDQSLVAFTDEDMSYYSSREHYNLCKKGKSLPIKVHKFKDENLSSRFPLSKCSGSCRQTFDPGNWCQDRRLRGTIEIELEAFSNTGNCMVIYEAEAETTWFKRIGYVWWKRKADRVTVSMDWGIFNSRGGVQIDCYDTSPIISRLNASNINVSGIIRCTSDLIPPREACADAYDYNQYGIIKGLSNHFGMESGNCGGTRTCSTNCI
ncbi:MAG: hypothetical protein WAT79_08050 [Saprospiraceae bacterium]